MNTNDGMRSWGRVAEIATVLQDGPREKKRKKLLRELLALAEEQRALLESAKSSEEYTEETDTPLVFLVGDPKEIDSAAFSKEVVWLDDAFSEGISAVDDPFEGDEEDDEGHGAQKQSSAEDDDDSEHHSILNPVEGVTRVMPDVATDISDFFSVPEASKDDIIWRAPMAAKDQAASDGETGPITETEIKEEAVVADASVGDKVNSIETRLGKAYGLRAALIAEMGIEPEVLSALLAETEEDSHEGIPTGSEEVSAKSTIEASADKVEPSKDAVESEATDGQTPKGSSQDSKRRGSDKKKAYGRQALAGFKQIYTSRDGALCVYQDSVGHIVSVNTSKLV